LVPQEVTGWEIVLTEERASPDWSVAEVVWTPRGRLKLVVQRRSSTDMGASFPSVQPLERPAQDALADGGKGHRLEDGHMPTCADF